MDLFFRLNVLNLKIPALRERKADIYPLFEHFVKEHNSFLGEQILNYRNEISTAFGSYSWPGNIRELQNISTRFVTSAQHDYDILNNIRALQENLTSFSYTLGGDVSKTSSNYIRKRQILTKELLHRIEVMLEETKGNKAEAARRLRISRTTLWRWLSASISSD